MIILPTKDPSESVVLRFVFAGELSSITAANVAISVNGSGSDPAVSAVLDGIPQISGTDVLQRISIGVSGVDYKLRCLATNGSDIVLRVGILPVRAE